MREQAVIAARISGVDPSMHIILKPNSDGDEATITSADVVAGSSYLHKIDAVLVPKSTLVFLDSFTADSGKKKSKNATVSEVFGKNATDNGTDVNATAAGNETVSGNATAKNATSAAISLAVSSLLGAPLLLAAVLLL
jgi:hypothetical protein